MHQLDAHAAGNGTEFHAVGLENVRGSQRGLQGSGFRRAQFRDIYFGPQRLAQVRLHVDGAQRKGCGIGSVERCA